MSNESERQLVERIIWEELTRGQSNFTTGQPRWITRAVDRIIKERTT